MTAALQFKTLGLKKAILIDDSFAPPSVNDIDGEAVTRMNEALRDVPERVEQGATAFGATLDPNFPERTRDFLGNSELLERLWIKRLDAGWEWLHTSVFSSYEAEGEPKLAALRPIIEYFAATDVTLRTYATFSLVIEHIPASDIVFLDFFLKNEQQPEPSFSRAEALAELMQRTRLNNASPANRYPLFVLFSSRPEATRLAPEFKSRSSLRGCFFQFLSKTQMGPEDLETCLARLLPDYERNQRLATLLDGYWLAALRAAGEVRKQVLLLEPTDVALLHAAALIAENERFSHYLEWLIGGYLSTAFSADKQLKALSNELVEIGSKMPLPGHIPANRTLSELFIATTVRTDLADQTEHSKQYELALGDIYVEGDPEAVRAEPERLLVVIDQSCDLTHAVSKERVLCLRAWSCLEIKDMALAIYESETWPTNFLGLTLGGKQRLFRVTWNLVDPDTIARAALDGRQGFVRLARLRDLSALQLQERFLQNVGRIGTAVQPPPVGAYSARLRLGRDTTRRIFDARGEPWAAVTVVSGRTPRKQKVPREGVATAEAEGTGKPKTRKQKSANESDALLELWFCGEFVEWLSKNLPTEYGEDVALRGLVDSFRKLLKQEGGPRGKLGSVTDSGMRTLNLGEKPAQVKLDVVETDELFDTSKEIAVLQIVEHNSTG